MPRMLDPFQFLLLSIAGWMNQHQQQVVEYVREENRVLREQLGNRRVLFNDDQHRRLAVRAKRLGRKLLAEVATLVTPDTLLAWHRKLIAPLLSEVAVGAGTEFSGVFFPAGVAARCSGDEPGRRISSSRGRPVAPSSATAPLFALRAGTPSLPA
jgi:hypothetical protein